MKTNKVLNILLIALVLLIVASCNKDKKPFHSIDPATKAKFNYQIGSYWVFKDSVTGKVDSMYVYDNQHFPNLSSDKYDLEVVNIYLKMVGSDTAYYQFGLTFNGSSMIYSAKADQDTNNVEIEFGSLFTYPFTSSLIVNLLPTLAMNGTVYTNVAECHNQGTSYPPLTVQYADWYYFDEPNGFLKIRLNHSGAQNLIKTYELIRANPILP